MGLSKQSRVSKCDDIIAGIIAFLKRNHNGENSSKSNDDYYDSNNQFDENDYCCTV